MAAHADYRASFDAWVWVSPVLLATWRVAKIEDAIARMIIVNSLINSNFIVAAA